MKWIPCKEQRPRLGDLVLSATQGESGKWYVLPARLLARDLMAPQRKVFWQFEGGLDDDFYETDFWMPLPEPPQ